jgi:hypothetical protein
MGLKLFGGSYPDEMFKADLLELRNLPEKETDLLITFLESSVTIVPFDEKAWFASAAGFSEEQEESFRSSADVARFVLSEMKRKHLDFQILASDLTELGISPQDIDVLIAKFERLGALAPKIHYDVQRSRELKDGAPTFSGSCATFDLRAVYDVSDPTLDRSEDPLIGFEPVVHLTISTRRQDTRQTFTALFDRGQFEEFVSSVRDYQLRLEELAQIGASITPRCPRN